SGSCRTRSARCRSYRTVEAEVAGGGGGGAGATATPTPLTGGSGATVTPGPSATPTALPASGFFDDSGALSLALAALALLAVIVLARQMRSSQI
ncbi:MAG TPA: hypothetical protein PLC98_15125, partial [Anaerolineales bacterium]|nr:hypothetical protein [Anaerolineales bacterium]